MRAVRGRSETSTHRSAAHPLVLEQTSQFPQGSMYGQNGINTGRLFETPLVAANCPMMVTGNVCEPGNPTSYYTWATGPQQWQRSLCVPILLQFNGFGNLTGIPGRCVDPVNNAPVRCDVQNARYVPLFAIPDGASMTLPNPSTPLIVKALNAELRLKDLGANRSLSVDLDVLLSTAPGD